MITANAQPPPTNILMHKRGKKSEPAVKEDDADGVQHECKFCQRMFNTPSQLTSEATNSVYYTSK
jgi:hypothetical protein